MENRHRITLYKHDYEIIKKMTDYYMTNAKKIDISELVNIITIKQKLEIFEKGEENE